MTADQFHDALSLLPADLIAETDKKRGGRPVLRRKRIAAMAACFAVLLGCGWYSMLLFGSKGSAAPEQAAAEAPVLQENSLKKDSPMEAAPAEPQRAELSEEAPAAAEPEAEDTCGLPTAPAGEGTGSAASGTLDEALRIDHDHRPGEPAEEEETGLWCGNMQATVYRNGKAYTLSGGDAVTLTDILYRLDYREEDLCRCAAAFTADTEMGTGYAVDPDRYFARYNGGQAALTEAQADTLRRLLEGLEE